METEVKYTERLLNGDPLLPREAWRRMQGWYISAVDHSPSPAQITLEWITAERVELYRAITPLGENTPMSVKPYRIDDSVPTEEEVDWAVRILRGHR